MGTDGLLAEDDFAEQLGGLHPDEFLSPAETLRFAEMRSPARKEQWLAGRWLAKRLIERLTSAPRPDWPHWHIESRDGRGRPTRPRLFRRGQLLPWNLSISHSKRFAYVAINMDEQVRVGVDVTATQPLSDAFTRLWFTPTERHWCARDNVHLLRSIVWSVKESYYKATFDGRPFRPRQIDSLEQTPLGQLPAEELEQEGCYRRVAADPTQRLVCHKLHGAVATAITLRPAIRGFSLRENALVRGANGHMGALGAGLLTSSIPRLQVSLCTTLWWRPWSSDGTGAAWGDLRSSGVRGQETRVQRRRSFAERTATCGEHSAPNDFTAQLLWSSDIAAWNNK